MARKFGTNIDMQQNEIVNVVLDVLGSAPSSPALGRIYYDSGLGQVGICTDATGPVWSYFIVTLPDATGSVLGVLKLTGDLGGTASSPEVVNLHLSGNTSIGYKLTNVTDPTNPQDAATKNYVDNAIFGLSPQPSVAYATAGALPTYTGTGTGTLTGTATTALSVDGEAVTVGQRILVKNETGGLDIDNGIYTVSATGGSGAHYVLTYALSADGTAPVWADFPGQLVPVDAGGSVNASTVWLSTAAQAGTLGTTAIGYTQIGSGLSVSGDGTYTTTSGSEVELLFAADVSAPGNGDVATITTGAARVVKTAVTGNGVLTSFTITHNLGSFQLGSVQGQLASAGDAAAPIELDWAPGTDDTVIVTFPAAPANAVTYFITIVG